MTDQRTNGPTDRRTDQPTVWHSRLWSRLHATINGVLTSHSVVRYVHSAHLSLQSAITLLTRFTALHFPSLASLASLARWLYAGTAKFNNMCWHCKRVHRTLLSICSAGILIDWFTRCSTTFILWQAIASVFFVCGINWFPTRRGAFVVLVVLVTLAVWKLGWRTLITNLASFWPPKRVRLEKWKY